MPQQSSQKSLSIPDTYVSKFLKLAEFYVTVSTTILGNFFLKHLVAQLVKSYNFISQPSPKLMHTRCDIALLKILFAYISLKLSHLLTLIQVQSHHFLPLLFSQLEPNSSEKPALRKEKSQLQLRSPLTTIIIYFSVFSFSQSSYFDFLRLMIHIYLCWDLLQKLTKPMKFCHITG